MYMYIYIHDFIIYIVHVSYNGFDSQVSCFWPSFSSDLWLWWICFWAFWWRPGAEWTDCFFHHPRFPTVPTMYGDAGIFFFSMKAVKISADMLRQAWNWAIFSNSATQTNTVNQALGTQSSPDGKAIKTVSTIEREQLEVDFAKRVLWDLINRGRHFDSFWIIFWSRSHGSCRNFETLGIYQICIGRRSWHRWRQLHFWGGELRDVW